MTLWQCLKLSWIGNGMRIFKRTLLCEQRERWHKDTLAFVRFSTNNYCFYCRRQLDQHAKDTHMHVDHYWPWSKGGSNELGNLVPSCARCNLAKGNKPPKLFMRRHDYVQAFCRHRYADTGRYCESIPTRPNKYCFQHQIVRCGGCL
jgi:hypothetical protein